MRGSTVRAGACACGLAASPTSCAAAGTCDPADIASTDTPAMIALLRVLGCMVNSFEATESGHAETQPIYSSSISTRSRPERPSAGSPMSTPDGDRGLSDRALSDRALSDRALSD